MQLTSVPDWPVETAQFILHYLYPFQVELEQSTV